jgi:YfiH family protein
MSDIEEMILPAAPAGFRWVVTAQGGALVCDAMESLAPHLFTTRAWRLGDSPRDDVKLDAAWSDVASALELTPASLVRARQVHGAAVLVGREAPAPVVVSEADILVASARDLGCAVQTADCVPVLLVDPRSRVVAAAHAGWRGLALRVPEAAVAVLTSESGAAAADLIAVVGPAIGPCCYEVGDEVRGTFAAKGFGAVDLGRWFTTRAAATPRNPSMLGVVPNARPGHWYFDVWAAARDQLITAGMQRVHVHVAELCTASHPGAFCSYRRDGAGSGRMAAAIRSRWDR